MSTMVGGNLTLKKLFAEIPSITLKDSYLSSPAPASVTSFNLAPAEGAAQNKPQQLSY